MLMPLIFFISW